MTEMDNFDIVFNIFMLGVLGVFLFFLFIWTENSEEKQREKLYKENESFDAEKFSQKLKNSRVEMGLRKPKAFATKRKPQKKVK